MNTENLTYALLGGLAIALLVSVYTDLRYRLILNKVTLPVALAAPAYWYATGAYGLADIGMHLATAAAVFVVFTIFFHFRMMGGGDVKLFSALSLWFVWDEVIQMIFFASLFGGIVTLIFALMHKMKKQKGPVKVPYGVAIALSGLMSVSEPFFNHFG
jgi:prepilin peptidase CpaA